MREYIQTLKPVWLPIDGRFQTESVWSLCQAEEVPRGYVEPESVTLLGIRVQVITIPNVSTARGGDSLAHVLEIQGIPVIDYHPCLPLVFLDDSKRAKLDHIGGILGLRAGYH